MEGRALELLTRVLDNGITCFLGLSVSGLIIISVLLLTHPRMVYLGESLSIVQRAALFAFVVGLAVAEKLWSKYRQVK